MYMYVQLNISSLSWICFITASTDTVNEIALLANTKMKEVNVRLHNHFQFSFFYRISKVFTSRLM